MASDNAVHQTTSSNDIFIEYLKKIDSRLQKVETKLDKLDKLEKTVNNFEAEVKKIWLHVDKTTKQISDRVSALDERMDNTEWLDGQQESRLHQLEEENAKLRGSVTYLQSQSMRNNLIFSNIPEEANEKPEDTEKVVTKFMVENLKLAQEYVDSIKIERAHRIGAYDRTGNNKIRNIVCKFNLYKDREAVKQKRTELKGTKFFVNEQFPPEVVAKRKRLLPHLKQAKEANKRAWIAYDTLYIDGKAVKIA